MKCTVCRREVRKTRRVLTLMGRKARPMRVCAQCIADDGITLVAVPRRVEAPAEGGDKRVARDERAMFKALESWLRGQVRAYQKAYDAEVEGPINPDGDAGLYQGRIEAYEAVLEKIKGGSL